MKDSRRLLVSKDACFIAHKELLWLNPDFSQAIRGEKCKKPSDKH
jgi:hypothetical protein